MSIRYHCSCARCRVRGLTGPAVLITIGILFLIGRSSWDWDWGFGRTWPIILLVIGAIKLAEAMASTEGHLGSQPPVPPQPPIVPPPPPPAV